MTTLEFFLLIALISTSAYMAASEVALFSLSRFQLRSIRERARAKYARIKKILADPGGLLVTILVVNEILNISISMLITRTVAGSIQLEHLDFLHIPGWGMHALLGTLITAPILLFVCEITPKTIAVRANQLIAPLTINTVTVIYNLFKPIRLLVKQVVTVTSRFSTHGEDLAAESDTLKESDFLLMVEEGHREGTVQASEVELIKNVFELDDTTVADVFTPLSQVRPLPRSTTVQEALASLRTQHYSRIPVIGASKKEVVGILYSKDLLKAKLKAEDLKVKISEIMLEPIFVPPTMKLNTLFRRFKHQKTHMAIVQKSTGDALGVITMSDVMDTLFDDLFPEDEE
jgi:CBS domain containing-hemolysin-like protein